MSFLAEQTALVRTPTVLVKLRLDYCQHTFGQAPCAAVGTPCYYTYVTCPDKPNYARGAKDYRFSSYQGALLADALPYLAKLAILPTEIKADQHVTRVGEINLEFCDDRPWPLANPDKAVCNFESAGTFWRNWLARNPNYRGRPAEVWSGFLGLPETDYELVFKGLITNVTVAEGRCTITLQDYLKKLEVKIPAEQSSENTLTLPYANGAELMVVDASEFAPATPGQPGLVKIEDENNGREYVSYTDRSLSGNRLTGCQGGRFGTVAVSHPVGCRVSNAVVWAEDSGTDGLPLDQIVLDLLVTHGGISGLDLAALELGATLGSDVGAAEVLLPGVGIDDYPATGVIRIGDELLRYSRKGRQIALQVVDEEPGPPDDEHSLDQGTGLEQWHFVRFATAAGDASLDRVSLQLRRTGALSGKIYLYLYADQAGHPGTRLDELGAKSVSLVRVDDYGDLVWDKHLRLTPSTTYWLGYRISALDGNGELFQALQADAATSEFKHARNDAGPFAGIAGRPLFKVERSGGAFDTFSGCTRGVYGTDPAAHGAGEAVCLLEVSDEVGRWLASARYRRFLEKPEAIKDLLRELRQCTLAHLWQGEDSRVHFKCAPVPSFRDLPKRLRDAEHLVRQSLELDRNEEARKTRITVYYDPLTADPGTDPEQYRAVLLHLDQEVEGENYYGEKRNYEIFAPWIYRAAEALNAAAHFLMRFRYGAPLASFGLELKDADLQVGDFVRLDTDLILAPDAARADALYEVVKKKPAGLNRFDYQALEAAGGGLKRYAGISPVAYTADYDSYGDNDHSKYAWISDAGEKVGANADPGYYIS